MLIYNLYNAHQKSKGKPSPFGAVRSGGAGGGRTGGGGADAGGESHGILEGISSLHSWIKTQTMIRPHPKVVGRGGGKISGLYDDVSE